MKSDLTFRDLRADEIDVRVAMVKDTDKVKGVSLLLYKDARCDMNILDETVGAYNWQRRHSRENANCIVSIWDEDKEQWISKEDVGTESNTEAVKGLASDSFKRACFNWGIGRELYTAPFIWVSSPDVKIINGKCYDKFSVHSITITDKKITGLEIYNESLRSVVFTMGQLFKNDPPKKSTPKKAPAKKEEEPEEFKTNRDLFREYMNEKKISPQKVVDILTEAKCGDDSPDEKWFEALCIAKKMFG